MRRNAVKIILALAIIILLVLAGRYGFTVVTIEDVEQTVQDEAFDPVAYVDGIWESRVLPAFDEEAVALSEVLNEMEPDANGKAAKENLIDVATQYGLITVGEAHVYMVEGSGKIVDVNAETSLGTAEVEIDGYDGPIKAQLYIGTRIPSDNSSVRDAVGFITFGDFKEQTEYGKAATEINKRVLTTVLNDIDRENLIGKPISFKGAFTIRTFNLLDIDVNEIPIVPVEIELGE
jgi:predicted lipoprotein